MALGLDAAMKSGFIAPIVPNNLAEKS